MKRNPPNNDYFQLTANGGLPRHLALEALQSPKFIARAVATGRCFLCAASDIDNTALCLICRSFLSDEERRASQVYYESV
jgi:hypothetical protein